MIGLLKICTANMRKAKGKGLKLGSAAFGHVQDVPAWNRASSLEGLARGSVRVDRFLVPVVIEQLT